MALPPELVKRLRHAALDENRSMKAIVVELVEEYLSKKKR
jgi:hypothetical protein